MRCENRGWIIPLPMNRYNDVRDTQFFTHPLSRRVVFGVIRHLLYIDWLLSRYCRPELHTLPSPIRNILRIGTFQIRKTHDIPEWSAVDEEVKLAKKYGHAGTASLVNAVLRRVITGGNDRIPDREEDPVNFISVTTSHPKWLVRRWMDRWGFEKTCAICQGNIRHPSLTVLPNFHKVEMAELRKKLEKASINFKQGKYHNSSLLIGESKKLLNSEIFLSGCIIVQDEFQSLVCRLLDPQTPEMIFDLCAAPGGKSSTIVNLGGAGVKLYAIDASYNRLMAMKGNLERLGYQNATIVCADIQRFPISIKARKILLDVPCSGTGVLSKRPDIKWNKSEKTVLQNTSLQSKYLESAARLIEKGGILVYSTCSLEEEENERVVKDFLFSHKNFKIYEKSIELVPHLLHTEWGMSMVSEEGIPGGFAAPLQRLS
jgi:16S rRNA (cytosine967-C5)-methyltransferase